jgi:ATP-dependent exoDNAse (exonuclease V) alpha subunit
MRIDKTSSTVSGIMRFTASLFHQVECGAISIGTHRTEFSHVSSRRFIKQTYHSASYQLEDVKQIKFSPEQVHALKMAALGKNLFITGRAGTGKSELIKEIIRQAENEGKVVAVTAPTGMAALAIGGRTIHSWAGIGLGDKSIDFYVDRARRIRVNLSKSVAGLDRQSQREILKPPLLRVDMLIIDEISMV